MKLVVGLGNPGPEYERTRHNVGFDVVDRLARRFADPATSMAKSRFSGLVVDAQIAGEKVLLLKPTTYMNLSGRSVSEAVRFYKLDPKSDLLVVVDDVALPCGSIRLRGEGGSGGHNGLADIQQKLGPAAGENRRAALGRPVLGVDDILEPDGHPMQCAQRTAGLADPVAQHRRRALEAVGGGVLSGHLPGFSEGHGSQV